MRASTSYSILIIAVCALCTFGERLLPFLIFGKHKVPRMVRYLGRVLPMAIMTALVVYCLRTTAFTSLSAWLPQLAAAASPPRCTSGRAIPSSASPAAPPVICSCSGSSDKKAPLAGSFSSNPYPSAALQNTSRDSDTRPPRPVP